MHRRLLWLVSALGFVLAVWLLANLPALYARVKLDRSFPALSRYEFERTPNVVLIGSSMTFRVSEGYFLKKPVRNIAISGGSPLTGLAIVESYESVPRLALVEANIMSRPIDHTLIEHFGRNDTAPYLWFRPFRSIISAVYYWIKTKSEAEKVAELPHQLPSQYDISDSVKTTAKVFNERAADEAIAASVDDLRSMVANLEKRGCHVVFFELPWPGDLSHSHFAELTHSLMHAAFPDARRWLNLILDRSELRWVDAAHMDERSAILVAKEIEKHLASSD